MKHAFIIEDRKKLWTGMSIFLLLISIALRVIFLPFSNTDMSFFNLHWYQTLATQGIWNALGTNFSNYSPPYTYLLALATLTKNILPPLTAIKLIPTAFDLLSSFLIYRIVKIKYISGNAPLLAATFFLSAPTIMLNSSFWGQADSIYTCFLIICIYCLLINRPATAMTAFGTAFAIKAQAVFLFPLLLILGFRRQIPMKYFFLIPIVYLASILPVVSLGRPFLDALLVYARQSGTYSDLSMNAPNPYFIFPNQWYQFLSLPGTAVAIFLVAYWIYATARNERIIDHNKLILYALISVAITPFLLPKMHDRYFYPADVLSIILVFYWPGLWFIPMLYQIISIISISPFLFNAPSDWIIFAALLNMLTIAMLLRAQRRAMEVMDHKPFVTSFTTWLVAGIIPIVLLGLSVRLITTACYFRIYYNLPHPYLNMQNYNKADLYQKAALFIDYATNARGDNYLARFQFTNGTRVFEDQEVVQAVQLKQGIQDLAVIWHIFLVVFYALGLLAWAGNWLPQYRLGAARGGWLTICLIPVLGAVALTWLNNSQQMAFIQLFPLGAWQSAVLFSIFFCAGAGILLGKISSSNQNNKNIPS